MGNSSNRPLKNILRQVLKKTQRAGCDDDPTIANLLASNVPSFEFPTITLDDKTARPITPDRLQTLLQEIDDKGEFVTQEEAKKFLDLLGMIFWGVELRASPQVKNGHIRISNEIAEAFKRLHITGNQWKIIWVILLKTWAWHKKKDRIPISQFQKGTGLKRRHVSRAISDLVARNIVTKNGDGFITSYAFQKDYTKWKTVTKNGDKRRTVTIFGTQSSPKTVHSKEIYQKKEYYVEGSDELRLASFLLEEIQKNKPSLKKPNIQCWAKEIDFMIRLDGRNPERIQEVILWCQSDSFWWKNVLSTGKLRKQFDRLEVEMVSSKRLKDYDPYEDFPVIGESE